MRHVRPHRLPSFDYIGFHRYSLTFCTDARRELFRDADAVALVLAQIVRASIVREFEVLAYCFMPDHAHLLVHGRSESADCRAFICLAKQYSGYLYKKRFGTALWQRYAYERVLRSEEQSLTVARYILNNPVRAKLVATVRDYPFSGSLTHEREDLLASMGA